MDWDGLKDTSDVIEESNVSLEAKAIETDWFIWSSETNLGLFQHMSGGDSRLPALLSSFQRHQVTCATNYIVEVFCQHFNIRSPVSLG